MVQSSSYLCIALFMALQSVRASTVLMKARVCSVPIFPLLSLMPKNCCWLLTTTEKLFDVGVSVVLPFGVLATEVPNTILLTDKDYKLPHHEVEYVFMQ